MTLPENRPSRFTNEEATIEEWLAYLKKKPNALIAPIRAKQLREAGYTGKLNVMGPASAEAPPMHPDDPGYRSESEGPDFSGNTEDSEQAK